MGALLETDSFCTICKEFRDNDEAISALSECKIAGLVEGFEVNGKLKWKLTRNGKGLLQ
jgi:hypothetical protein